MATTRANEMIRIPTMTSTITTEMNATITTTAKRTIGMTTRRRRSGTATTLPRNRAMVPRAPLLDLAGYRIYWHDTSGAHTGSLNLDNTNSRCRP